MSVRKPTSEQQAAIDAAGEVLVSASAGSGKTFVMIEKIISLILSGRADVSSVLAVTFTKAAAAEMKERLRSAIFARIGEVKDEAVRARLKAQLSEIGTADICTLHSFCSNVIRRYFYEADADGNFRVADEAETEKLKTRAVSLTFDKLLAEKSEKFALLCKVFAGSRGFGKLTDVLQKSYEKAIVRADFNAFLRELPSRYDGEHFARLAEEAFEPAARYAKRLKEKCAALEKECAPYIKSGVFGEKHAGFLAARALFADDVLAAGNVFDAAALVRDVKLINKPPNTRLKNAGDAAALELDARLGALKDDVDAIKKSLSPFRTREEEEGAFCASGEVAAALCELILEFSDTFAALKRRAGVLDFSDLEHKCLELLQIPAVCEEVRGRYTHVFVDEYQDVNPAQERILSLVAGENVFMVGDAKQSIYGFRGCSAGFFAEKYARLAKEGRALTLNGNFRSCKNILDTVNTLFSAAMTEEVGSVDYAATSMMQAGSAAQAGGEVRFEFVPEKEEAERAERDVYSVVARLGLQEDEEYAEGALIANIVLSEVGRSRPDPSSGEERKMGFGDIVVLTRGKTEKAGRIVGELVRRGIPVAASAEVNVCDYPEVKTMLAVLQYLDNGAQDIPLAAALKSDMGGVTDEELAKIRLAAEQDDSFSAACAAYEKNGDALAEKLQAFRARAEHFRLLSTVKNAAEVMAAILAETGMELTLLSLPCGEERVRRLRRFMAEAGELNVPEFLDRLKNGGYKVGFSESGGENAVRVMTMHASKGLEFPVVIVAGLNGKPSCARSCAHACAASARRTKCASSTSRSPAPRAACTSCSRRSGSSMQRTSPMRLALPISSILKNSAIYTRPCSAASLPRPRPASCPKRGLTRRQRRRFWRSTSGSIRSKAVCACPSKHPRPQSCRSGRNSLPNSFCPRRSGRASGRRANFTAAPPMRKRARRTTNFWNVPTFPRPPKRRRRGCTPCSAERIRRWMWRAWSAFCACPCFRGSKALRSRLRGAGNGRGRRAARAGRHRPHGGARERVRHRRLQVLLARGGAARANVCAAAENLRGGGKAPARRGKGHGIHRQHFEGV